MCIRDSGRFVTIPLLFVLLLLIYTYVPGGRRTLRSQLPGTIFALSLIHIWCRASYIFCSNA